MLERLPRRREIKRNWIILVLTAFVLVVVALLMFSLHANKETVVSQFQDHQFLHAQNIAKQIESLLTTHSMNLQTLSSLLSLHDGDMKQKKAMIQAWRKQLEKIHAEAISYQNEFGQMVYMTRPRVLGLKEETQLTAWAKKKENRGKVLTLTLLPEEGRQEDGPPAKDHQVSPLRFLLAVPVYRETAGANPASQGEGFAGLLTLSVDLKEFLDEQLGWVDPATNLHQAWIIDERGTLLLQSEQHEMTLRNIHQKGESCDRCHTSFDYVEKILREREGTVDYQLKNLPKKFAAFAPMEFENATWIVVVNSTLNDMTAYIRKDLKGTFMLLGIVVLTLIVSSALISHDYRMIARVEEERLGTPLLVPFVDCGALVREDTLAQMRDRARAELFALPEGLREVDGEGSEYPVTYSPDFRSS